MRRGFHPATLPWSPDRWSVAVMVVLLEVSPISTQDLWNSPSSPSWSPLIPRPFSCSCSVWPGSQLQEQFWLFRTSSILVSMLFLKPFPDLCLDTILSAYSNHVQSIEFTTSGLQSKFRNISKMIKRNGRHLRQIPNVIAKGLSWLLMSMWYLVMQTFPSFHLGYWV